MANRFSDFIIYVDESGDHSLTSIDESYPVFVLAFCIFRKSDYVNAVVPALQRLKFKWFGHDLVVLHENDIVKRKGPFGFLQFEDLRSRFMADLNTLMQEVPMTVVATVIRKEQLASRYREPDNPYGLALWFCMERAARFIRERTADRASTIHAVCETRSGRQKGAAPGREDLQLALEFRRIVAGTHSRQSHAQSGDMRIFEIAFASKQANSAGLQLADLVARPIGLKVLRPDQPNRAFDILEQKLQRPGDIKVFP